MNYCFCCHQAWNLYCYLKACFLKDEERVELSKQPASWKITLQRMTGNVTSEVDATMCVALRWAQKHVPYLKLVGTTEGIML